MIKYKNLLLGINALVAVIVLGYGLSHIEMDPISLIVAVFVTLTTLILVNLLYFDLEHFVLELISKLREKASLNAQASQAN